MKERRFFLRYVEAKIFLASLRMKGLEVLDKHGYDFYLGLKDVNDLSKELDSELRRVYVR